MAVILIILGFGSPIAKFVLDHDYLYGAVPRFDLDRENNIPTYFSSMLLLFCSALLATTYLSKKKTSEKYANHWLALAGVFLYLSVDESASLHELLYGPMRRTFDLSGYFYFGWVAAGKVFVVILAVIHCRWLWSLPSKTRCRFILTAMVYISGAIGLELIGGNYIASGNMPDFTFALITAVEESLEITGLLLFIYALLDYLKNNRFSAKLTFI